MNAFSEAAAAYARRGWVSVPVEPGTPKPYKPWTPLVDNPEAARRQWQADPERVARMFAKYPNAELSIVCGPSGLVVVDVDTKHGAVRPDGLPETATVRTPSGGWHLYYLGATRARSGQGDRPWRPGVDVLGTRSIAKAPPSPGRVWTNDLDPVPLPAWAAEEIGAPVTSARQIDPDELNLLPPDSLTRYGRKALETECARLEEVPEGGRNAALNKAAFRLGQLAGAQHLSVDVIELELSNVAGVIGLDDDEAAKTIFSGLTAGLANPRSDKEDAA